MKLRTTILAVFLFSNVGLFGSSGQAVIPHLDWGYQDSNNRSYTSIYVSNVTNASVTVFVSLFNNSGALILDGDGSPSTGALKMVGSYSGYQESSSGASIEFTLGANQSATITVYDGIMTSWATGYGRIEWLQTGNNTVALVSHAKHFYKGSGVWSFGSIPIKQGLPY